jgi:hypothetical protein
VPPLGVVVFKVVELAFPKVKLGDGCAADDDAGAAEVNVPEKDFTVFSFFGSEAPNANVDEGGGTETLSAAEGRELRLEGRNAIPFRFSSKLVFRTVGLGGGFFIENEGVFSLRGSAVACAEVSLVEEVSLGGVIEVFRLVDGLFSSDVRVCGGVETNGVTADCVDDPKTNVGWGFNCGVGMVTPAGRLVSFELPN